MRDDVLIVCRDSPNRQIKDAWRRCLKATNPDIHVSITNEPIELIKVTKYKYIITTNIFEWIKNRIDVDYLISQYDSDTLFISMNNKVNQNLLSPFFDGTLFFDRQVLVEYLKESDITNRRIRRKRIGDSTCYCNISDDILKTGGNKRIRIESIIFSDIQTIEDVDIEWEFGG